MASVRPAPAGQELPVQRIKPAYKQVADQLRTMILDGTLAPGEQLPVEEKLGSRFGVSRNTVREALRILSSQNLVETTRGVAGGTFVARPDADALRGELFASLQLLNGLDAIDMDELYEARAVIEIPSTRAAAERRTEADLDRMRRAAGLLEHSETVRDRTGPNQDFHQAVLDAAGNRLLSMITPPIWLVLAKRSLQIDSRGHWADIDDDHAQILEHIDARRADEAAEAMRQHLERLRQNDL